MNMRHIHLKRPSLSIMLRPSLYEFNLVPVLCLKVFSDRFDNILQYMKTVDVVSYIVKWKHVVHKYKNEYGYYCDRSHSVLNLPVNNFTETWFMKINWCVFSDNVFDAVKSNAATQRQKKTRTKVCIVRKVTYSLLYSSLYVQTK